MQVDLLSQRNLRTRYTFFTNIPLLCTADQRCGANLYCQYLAGARCIAAMVIETEEASQFAAIASAL